MKKAIPVLALLALFEARPASAVMGVGDLTYDPQAVAQLMQIYEEMKRYYKTAQDQLEQMDKIQRTLNEAHQSYNALVNTDIDEIAKDLAPGRYLKGARNKDKIGALRQELQALQSKSAGYKDYYAYQAARLSNLERLNMLEEASAKNLGKSSTNLDPRASGQITAQSTATLAALAAAEEQRRQQEELARAAARKQERDVVGDSARLYRAMGSANRAK